MCHQLRSLPFVQRILNSNHSDRLRISASQMLFGNMLNLDKGLFLPKSEQLASPKPLSSYMSNLLSIQDNLLKDSAKELLRTDSLHMTNKEQNIHKEYLPNSYVLVHYRTGLPPLVWTRFGEVQRIQFPLYSSRSNNWQRKRLSSVRYEAFYP